MRAEAVLGGESLGRLMPLHLALNAEGQVVSLGPTLAKLIGEAALGQTFSQVLTVRRPAGIDSIAALRAQVGAALKITLGEKPEVYLGLAVPTAQGGLIVNLSFGIRLIEAVRQHALSGADFAPTDLAVGMLYVMEAKTAVMEELRRLNLRLQGAKVAAEEQALTDALTDLRNRRALELRLPQLIAAGVDFGLMHIDLDYFKQVNDTLGHAAGDHVLREVAKALVIETRSSDLVARVGGDEFVVVLPRIASAKRLMQIAARIIARISLPQSHEGQAFQISASIGLTLSRTYPVPDMEAMLADADAALYVSKRAGRGQASLHPGAAQSSLSA